MKSSEGKEEGKEGKKSSLRVLQHHQRGWEEHRVVRQGEKTESDVL
jgi:hypothetical protein